MRTMWSVVMGGAAGIVAMMLIEFIVSLIVPSPPQLDISRPGASSTYIEHLPLLQQVLPIVYFAIGSYVAAFVTMRRTHSASMTPGLIAGAVPLLAGVIDMAMIPHPIWMWALGLIALTLPAYFATRALMPKRATLRDAMQ